MVVDGVLDLAAMKRTNLSRPQLFANLRAANIRQLGQVKRAYLKASGTFSTFKQEPPQLGLSVLPSKDITIHQTELEANSMKVCGRPEPADRYPPTCPLTSGRFAR